MPAEWVTVGVVGVIFFATLVRSAFGFGEALLAVPLLALIMPIETAAPLAALVSITVAGIVIIQDRRDIHLRSALWLVLATLPGIPLGLWLLVRAPEPLVKSLLATVIIAFALHALLRRHRRRRLEDDRLAPLFGFAAGVLGGAYGMNGPPLVVFGTLRGWSPRHFRATLQGYFLPASMAVMLGYALAGLWTVQVTRRYLLCLPAVVVAVLLGRAINRRLTGETFLIAVHLGLILIGALLLGQAIR